ncbi:MAG: hypothetical protein ACHQD8_00715 [Chitinophagales bacterium]
MKNYLLLITALFFGSFCAAQGSDEAIQAKLLNGELTESSKINSDKKYYESFPVQMNVGDMLLIVCTSTDFVVGVGISDANGFLNRKEDDPKFFKTIGSKVTVPFKCKNSGTYNIVLSSKDAGAKGHFQAKLFYYNSTANKVNSNSSFCDKVKFIIANSPSGFEFLKSSDKPGIMGSFYDPNFYLFPGAYTKINTSSGCQYNCTVESSTDLESLKRKYDDLLSNLNTCLTGHSKKGYTPETVYDFEKKDFIRKAEFSLPGTNPVDVNSNHSLASVVDKIILRLDKDGADKYKLRIEVD